ncbi:CRISPR system precrRNA processing endoribonuclease RAMP protein Cas6 [Thiocapsa imhoffii]|uniref:CRISPR system precrRNA processing endoribonuclease RAMP protein Cas6 n=1 Tax=Thiocapsa imhoffii TaxID=382777 RepID=UPI001908B54A
MSRPALADLWPALWFGQWTHVGQGTAFGLGGIGLQACRSPTDEETVGESAAWRP